MEKIISNEALFQRELQRENPFMQFNSIELEDVKADYAVLRLKVQKESLNPHGMISGGLLCTMADNATAIAAHTDGGTYVTLNCSIRFLGNQKSGVIRAEARVRHRSRQFVYVDADITGEDGKLLLSGLYCLFAK